MKIFLFKEFIIKGMYSSEIEKQDIEKFLKIFNKVFNTTKSINWFENKYKNNLYGNSLILMCYKDNECIATQCFFRNDIMGEKAFQSADSSVLEEFQGLGIFSKLIEIGQEILGKDQYIYGFPNNNSLKTFINKNWYINKRKKYTFFKKSLINTVSFIEQEYLNMLLKAKSNNIFYVKKYNNYYLVAQKKYNLYVILGKISKENLKNLKKPFFPILLIYSDFGKIGNGMLLVENYKKYPNIPIYKIDTLL